MNDCIDVKEAGNSIIVDFDRRLAALPDDLCSQFNAEARELETGILTLYKFVVLMVKKEENTDKVASLWGRMVEVCDDFSKRLANLQSMHPHCGAAFYHDRVLDLRNKCSRLQQMHS